MAKNIMVSNKVYEDLKKAKGERSFSEVIAEAMENSRKKTFRRLREFAGILKDEKEDNEMIKWLKKAQKITDDEIWKELR